MFVAYLMPNDAPDPRDGIGFITIAPTEERGIENLQEQIKDVYKDEGVTIEWHVGNPEDRPHVEVRWPYVKGEHEFTELYWLCFAEEK